MLVIFDVDGTLISGEAADWVAFDEAIEEVLSFRPEPSFYDSFIEITAQSIAEHAIAFAGRDTGQGLEEQIRTAYYRRLRDAHAANPNAFVARNGVHRLLAELRSLPGIGVAIATGDWLETISFKLAVAGVDVAGIPMATSTDCKRRPDIIREAALRAQQSLEHAIYVGDGVWDLRACAELGIPFVGTGAKVHVLREAGALHLHEDFAAVSLRETLTAAVAFRKGTARSGISQTGGQPFGS